LGILTSNYRYLANLLIFENRLDEATQVINLLRDQEFFDFDRAASKRPEQTVLTAHESATNDILQVALDKVISADQPLSTFERALGNRPPTSVETTELNRLAADSDRASAEFRATLKSLETDFDQPVSARDNVGNVPDTRDMRAALRELGASTKQKTAALYTLIGDDRFHLILIQPDGELRSFESPIKAADLNQKILQFYALLQTPTYNPRLLGKQLYDIILGPIEAELKKTGVQTLIWQLDGNLRYIPMAALFDDKQYLMERYQNVIFTRGNRERLTRSVSQNWTGVGFGSTRPRVIDLFKDGREPDRLGPLPGATAVLQSLFRVNGNARGIFDGEVFQDEKFTETAFYEALKRQRPLVYISSHFVFRPGDDSHSYLLLGDGKALTLNKLKEHENLFSGVELLTLSACNTAAAQPNADGKEIDGFAELAQRLGASAVMATLWQVSEGSTQRLMQEFYTTRQSNGGKTKAEALKDAQLRLLTGTATPKAGDVKMGGGEFSVKVMIVPDASKEKYDFTGAVVYVSAKDAPLFKQDSKQEKIRPFAHPYYWAPFILIGNWK